MTDLDALKMAFCSGTPGTWSHGWDGQSVIVGGVATGGAADADRHYGGKLVCKSVSMLDQAAIIAAHAAVPDLVAEVEELRQRVALMDRLYVEWIERAGNLQTENGRLAAELSRLRLALAGLAEIHGPGEVGEELEVLATGL